VALPVIVPALSIEIKALYLADTTPTPATGYEVILLKDLGFTQLWVEFKVITS